MGDYSSTFKILNRLQIDLHSEYQDPTDGYWLRTVGTVEANSTSDDSQLKDKFGIHGSDGQVHLKGKLNGKDIVIWIHVKCGTAQNNVAHITSPSSGLALSVTNFAEHVNPMIAEFIIERKV